ncbi:MAG: SdrD B-like domain-containing protein, partial [Pirellulales bacterium]
MRQRKRAALQSMEPLEQRLALAAVLDVSPLTWDVVGLDSNKPTTSGPDTFLVGARITNTGDQTISGVQATLDLGDTVRLNAVDQWATIANDYITAVGPTTLDSTFTIAPGDFVDAYFSVRIDRTSDAFTTARRYDITASDGVISDSLDTTHQLYVEQLVSQNRNSTQEILVLNGTTPVTSARPGDVLTIVHRGKSAPGGYEQTTNALTLPTDVFEVLSTSSQSVTTAFSTDSTSRLTSPVSGVYMDAAGWRSDPGVLNLDPTYNTPTDNQKAGGEMMETTYQVRVRPSAPVGGAVLTGVIYDYSGSSFHYNADSGLVFKTVQISGNVGVSGRVWRDVNANNRQDGTEPGVLGVPVELRDAGTDALVATTFTDENGSYLFSDADGLSLNTAYVIRFAAPTDTVFVRANAPGSNATNDSDANVTTGRTAS